MLPAHASSYSSQRKRLMRAYASRFRGRRAATVVLQQGSELARDKIVSHHYCPRDRRRAEHSAAGRRGGQRQAEGRPDESHRRHSSEGNLARSPGRGRAIMCFCSMALGSRHVVHVQAWAPFVSSTTPIQYSNVRRQFAPAQPQAPPAPHYFCLRHTTQNTRRSHNERSPHAYASTQINRSRTDENHPRTRTAAQQTRREPPK